MNSSIQIDLTESEKKEAVQGKAGADVADGKCSKVDHSLKKNQKNPTKIINSYSCQSILMVHSLS